MEQTTTSHQIIQSIDVDDDEFDWEAAVREIDVACEGAASTSRVAVEEEQPVVAAVPQPPQKKLGGGNTRQSTLDRFLGTGDRKSVAGNQSLSVKKRLVDGEIEGPSVRSDDDDDTACYTNVDLEAAKTWIYPVNIPVRDYQLSITKTALFSNTIVALPTGLGKTLIAAVVMYNYFRWFPEGKIVFTAPSRPLVMQQIEACHNIMGIPQEWTIDMTGQLSPARRACFWKEKRVFFVTPQVLEKDIQSGTCMTSHLVCLVIDEAHRATGNYAYCVAVRELMAKPIRLRILALTATPGSKQQSIQSVIDNLHISKLEHRDENDHDVSQYVHNRKLELIQVAMSDDATSVNNLLLEVIQPFVARLCAYGVLRNRDIQTWSPVDFLNSRDKFRQAPPPNLPDMKYGEVEGYFGVLITLYHIRKLLSSHGVRPAYDMLQDKLKQGSFARYLSKNELIWKAKLVMQQSLSHGLPSPKLSKMIEVLLDHFKINDPKDSRVIIFTNFRDSVRDIMDSLSNFRELVKATEFIGQSSAAGKALKGQTQKAQQAVLQKFRSGGYNVIVATSIGEEGLDIMEVDLVICFDANVSPLRMIQRMGRTGRKHDGRVVILACEGSELKGYLRKQANSKAVKKHMNNGGMSSFNFHTSPRMIPHCCRPEVQFLEMSIQQFVPRGKKSKDDTIQRPSFCEKISDTEFRLIAKYYPSGEDEWKPSLIAFPHFQVFPSRVNKVMHSFRTGMLIDTMQSLQGLSFCHTSNTFLVEDGTSPCNSLGSKNNADDDTVGQDLTRYHDFATEFSDKKIVGVDDSVIVVSSCKEKKLMEQITSQTPVHCFLFTSDVISVTAVGMVSIRTIPDLPSKKELPPCQSTMETKAELLNKNLNPSSTSPGNCRGVLCADETATLIVPTDAACINSEPMSCSRLDEFQGFDLLTPSPKRDCLNSDIIYETPDRTRKNTSNFEDTNNFKDLEMSPRLSNMVEEGIVPESPIAEAYHSSPDKNTTNKCEHESSELPPYCDTVVQKHGIASNTILHCEELTNLEAVSASTLLHSSSAKLCSGLRSTSSNSEQNDQKKLKNNFAMGEYVSPATNGNIRTPADKLNCSASARGSISGSPVDHKSRTPLANLTNNSCSKDWRLSSRESSESVQQTKFKRLRKYRDKRMGEIHTNLGTSLCTTEGSRMNHNKGKQKPLTSIKDFIDEEAEVSLDAELSEEEQGDEDDDSYDDSFIDDRINPTIATTQGDAAGGDMMAVYRRSLFSPSSVASQPNCFLETTPDSCGSKIAESGSSSGNSCKSVQPPRQGLESSNQSSVIYSRCNESNPYETSLLVATLGNGPPERKISKIGSRKRKLSFCQASATSLQAEQLHPAVTDGAHLHLQAENDNCTGGVFSDDQFFEGLDLDALEAQATRTLRCKSDFSTDCKPEVPNLSKQGNLGVPSSPTFDLGF